MSGYWAFRMITVPAFNSPDAGREEFSLRRSSAVVEYFSASFSRVVASASVIWIFPSEVGTTLSTWAELFSSLLRMSAFSAGASRMTGFSAGAAGVFAAGAAGAAAAASSGLLISLKRSSPIRRTALPLLRIPRLRICRPSRRRT